MKTNEITKLAVEHWGKTAQTIKAIEELNELSQVLSKIALNLTLDEPLPLEMMQDLTYELADVEVMLEQVKQMWIKLPYLEQVKKFKERRTLDRIKNEKIQKVVGRYGIAPSFSTEI